MTVSKGMRWLLATTAAPLALAAPAHAQSADAPAPAAAAQADATPHALPAQAEERLTAMSLESPNARSGGGVIRPFGGGILPDAGTIRSFAGPVSGSAGTIRSFSGDTVADAGTIRSFAGTIRSFAGTIRSFQTNTVPLAGPDPSFWGALYPAGGTLTASAGTIRSFSGQFEAMAGTIRSFSDNMRDANGQLLTWTNGSSTYQSLDTQIAAMVAGAKTSWGAAVTAQTGQTFEAGFSDRMLAKYGIALNDPKSLVGMDEFGLEVFMLDYYDNLMLYSGSDEVDHWMKAVNWTPRITQDLGSGKDSKIGLLDFTVTGEGTANIVNAAGVSTVAGGHGSAVLSLMTGAHDGRGVMGIAPGASVVSYNPFDTSYTAGWTDIKNGVINLVNNGATIVNMSLGVPGWTLNSGWNDVFSTDAVSKMAKPRVFVLAAGNDGITQTQNVTWAFDKNPAIIVVGSVDPNGNISDFSNRPGTVCLTQDGLLGPGGACNTDPKHDKLMNRFIVAPGEWILVSDGAGGVTRMSGTSFAAPLVSGTVALIHDRWPWLQTKPRETTELILRSARDLGAPGADPVYGRGELDVLAALSPLDLGALTFKVSVNGGGLQDVKFATFTAAQRDTQISYWQANNAYVSAQETILSSYRDFQIPLSSKLAGQTVGTGQQYFMSYLASRFMDWFKAGGAGSGFANGPTAAFGSARYVSALAAPDGYEATMTAAPKAYRPGFRQDGVPFETGVTLRDVAHGYALRFGTGRGGAALGAAGFGMQSDYDPATGGANPFLGLASGAGYAAVDMALGEHLTVTTGTSRQNARRDLRWMSAAERSGIDRLAPYQATANTVTMRYQAAPWLTTTVGYTLLDEADGLLGTQSIARNDLAGGTRSDAATAAFDLRVSPTLSVSGSTTWGRTRAGDLSRQAIAVSDAGLISSAYQAAITKVGLLGHDRLRVTFSQPLHLERGAIDVSNVQVIDRQTGELGNVVQHFALTGTARRYLGEVLYGRDLGRGAALNLFGRANLNGTHAANESSLTLGSSFNLSF